MDIQTVEKWDVSGKTILLRVDLNVPRHNNIVTDTTRIDRLKPTIDLLRSKGAKILIISHFGRPAGEHTPDMSMAFLAPVLERSWNTPVKFSHTSIGENAELIAKSAKDGEVILMENLRFHKGEKANDKEFCKQLARLGDLYVNDAFSVSHRAHSSLSGISELLPSAAGLLLEEEINALSSALNTPEQPVLAVTGGSKISTKLEVLENLIEKVNYLVLGGGMANTFLYAKGYSMGRSLCEKDMKDIAVDIMNKADKIGCEIILPQDVVVVSELDQNVEYKSVSINNIPDDQMAIDVGEQTIVYVSQKIKQSRTIVWNGPLGVFEIKPFDIGTNSIARCVAEHTLNTNAVSIAGGGDTVAALENAGCIDDFSYISTAGGAFLEWLEGKELPGVKAVMKR